MADDGASQRGSMVPEAHSAMQVLDYAPRLLYCGKCGKVYSKEERHVCVPMVAGAFGKYIPQPAVKDDVYHPTHYSRWKMEPIEFIAINDLPWWLANVIKYTMRFDAKDGLQDLYKARSYLDMKIRQLEAHPRFWDKPVEEERKLNGEAQKERT